MARFGKLVCAWVLLVECAEGRGLMADEKVQAARVAAVLS